MQSTRRAPEAGWYGEAKRLHQQQAALNPTAGLQPPMQGTGSLYEREMDELRYERQGGAGDDRRPLESASLARQMQQLTEMTAGQDEVIVAASTEARPGGGAGAFAVQKA